MSEVVRLSFSIEKALNGKLEELVRASRYKNRSEFIRDLIRSKLVETEWKKGEVAFGTITFIYDHHYRGLSDKLIELQHHHHSEILAATHVHLSHDLCAEVILVKGKASEIREMSDLIRQQKGVLHASLSMSSTGRKLQ
ncbi:MAG TPA: nickel-responsive transcriptional regulator NikR [Candidatus Omnitrophota bacterium]|nr:nickel-responsive transcriptional regulator NikR [Candidatus Omnitrophota bacterium]